MSTPCHCIASWLWSPVIAIHPSLWCCVGSKSDDERATSLTWHLAPGLANSKGEGGLTSLLSIVWWQRHRCLVSMWLVVQLVTWHCHIGRRVMVVGDQCGGWWALWVAVLKRQRWQRGGGAWAFWMMLVVEEQERWIKDGQNSHSRNLLQSSLGRWVNNWYVVHKIYTHNNALVVQLVEHSFVVWLC